MYFSLILVNQAMYKRLGRKNIKKAIETKLRRNKRKLKKKIYFLCKMKSRIFQAI